MTTVNILFIGDVVGEPGLKIVEEQLSNLKEKYSSDFVIINGENSSEGKGITAKEAELLFQYGANVITSGNHVWDNWKSKPLLSENPLVLRPFNYPSGNAGRGYAISMIRNDIMIGVLNLQGRTFMQAIDCPFRAADYAIKLISEKTKIIMVDFHADATAEKQALAHYLDGKVSAIIGTHTHVQTNDARILNNGSGYITDVGMTGPFDSVVGMKKEIAIKRFTLQTPHKFELASDDVKISGVNIKIDVESGKTLYIENFVFDKDVD